jgi:hypothetical protein
MTRKEIRKYIKKHYQDGMLIRCAYDRETFAEFNFSKIHFGYDADDNDVWIKQSNMNGEEVYVYDRDTGEFAERYTKVITKVLLTEKA